MAVCLLGVATLAVVDVQAVFEPPWLLPLLNTTFMALIPFVVAGTAARVFVAVGSRTALLLGCGAVALGCGGSLSGWFLARAGGPNVTITIFDTGALLSAGLHVVASLLGPRAPAPGLRPARTLAFAYGAVAAVMVAVVLAASGGVTPPFIVQGVGPTATGRVALLATIVMFGASAILLLRFVRGAAGALVRWYAMGLGLIAVGLTGVLLQKAVGSPIGWAGRWASYAGSLYLLVGVVRFHRTIRATDARFDRAVALLFRDAEANYRALVDTANDAIVATDDEGRVLLWNPAAERLFGFRAAEAIGVPLARLIGAGTPLPTGPDPPAAAGAVDAGSAATGGAYVGEIDVRTRDGRTFPAELSVSRRRARSGAITTCVIKDVTARKRAEADLARHRDHLEELVRDRTADLTRAIDRLRDEIATRERVEAALRESRALLQAIVDGTSDAVYVKDRGGRYVLFNAAAERFTGKRAADALGKDDHFLFPPVEATTIMEGDRRVMETGQPATYEEFLTDRAGEPLVFLSTKGPVRDEHGTVIGLFGIARDITTRRKSDEAQRDLERRLLDGQKLESLGVLAGGIAHDFNNLLMAVLGNLDLARRELPPTSAPRARLDDAMRAVHRGTHLTRQMLAYSGKGQFVVTDVDLSALVVEHASMFRSAVAKTITLDVHAAGVPRIRADVGQLQQVVMNLITNAAEAVGEAPGRVVLATGVAHVDAERLARGRVGEAPAPGRFVWLTVADTGCGMDAATLARIFEPFFTTKFTGRGLGLSAVLGIVKGHGGTLFVESEPGRGTTVTVLFPAMAAVAAAVAPDAPAVADPAPDAAASRPALTILVVDDEPAVRASLRGMVEHCGGQVLLAEDGEAAVAVLEAHADRIDGVLLDLTMPRMDGVAAFAALRRIRPDLPVILCSGFSEQEATRRFTGPVPTAFLQKPYDVDALAAALARALRARP